VVAYVVSSDLIDLPTEQDAVFRAWPRGRLTEVLRSRIEVSS
jgi:hypothetical protein